MWTSLRVAFCSARVHKAVYLRVDELEALKTEAVQSEIPQDTAEHRRWKASVIAVMDASLPSTSATLSQFTSVRHHIGFWASAPGESERDARCFAARVADATALIDAAMYEPNLLSEGGIDATAYDQELWRHVLHSVEEARWEQVASAAATSVEDKGRRWSGNPVDEGGGRLVGQSLSAHSLAGNGPLALGSQINETTGWRNLALGFTAALNNVDRHNVQDRADLRLYALGVLGLASLLLTQMRFEHPKPVAATDRRI